MGFSRVWNQPVTEQLEFGGMGLFPLGKSEPHEALGLNKDLRFPH